MRGGWIAVLVVLLSVHAGMAGDLLVGVATEDITPPAGYRMAGYFQERVNTGIRDPLQAKAIVFRQGDREAALVLCDLVAITHDVSERARAEASATTGIPAANIAIAATHSHTGPLYFGVLRDYFHQRAVENEGRDARESVDYPRTLAGQLAHVIAEARSKAVPTRLEAGVAQETRLAFNRRFHMKDGAVRFNPGLRNPEIVRAAGPIDPDVGILLGRPADGGKPTVGLTVFALHLDTVGGTQYSADYPRVLESALRNELGPKFVSLFGTGTCGDINHVDVTATTVAKTEAIGTRLAETVLAALAKLEPISRPSLAITRRVITVPTQNVTRSQVAEAKTKIADIGTPKLPFLDAVRTVTTLDLDAMYPDHVAQLEVQVLRLSPDLAIVLLPGEVFVELGLAIKQGSPFRHTFVIELANSIPAYVPTRKAFAEGSYEIVNSRVAPGGGERMVATALELLKSLRSETP